MIDGTGAGSSPLFQGSNRLRSEENTCTPTLQSVALDLRSADQILERPVETQVDGAAPAELVVSFAAA